MGCSYPECGCAVSFPEGHQPSVETKCPRGFDLSDLSHSYPFLDLSRKLRVSYAQVLQMADRIDQGMSCQTGRLYDAVMAVCRAPWRWQYPPQGRGL